jgi:DNA modification methylase
MGANRRSNHLSFTGEPKLNISESVKLKIVYQPIALLKPSPRNCRTHSKHQIRQIAKSIDRFGFNAPVLVDAENQLIAGHGRVEAARQLGMKEVPTIRLDQLTPDQIRAYMIADNQIALNAGWDEQMLAIEFQELLAIDGADFDITDTGWEIAEIDRILDEFKSSSEPEEAPPEPDSDLAPITRSGDLWLLGKHRISCGNSLHQSTYRQLMGNRRAAVVFTDPPFNVPINGHAGGNGAIQHREFAMASGEMSESEFVSFLDGSMRRLIEFSANNSVHYLCMDWRHMGELLAAAKQNYDEFLNLCAWVKNQAGMGSFYRSQHELIAVFRKGTGSHRNNIQLGKFGRNRSNVWQYPGIQTLSKQSDEGNLLAMHPTVKPIVMVADAILDCSARGEIVLDAFLGSGTTLMAAERVGRICCGIEIDPKYVDVAVRRWQKYTGEAAIHAETGKRFDEIAREREDQ